MATISALGVGSGLDLTGLLDQLNAAERQKLQPVTAQRSQEQAKISAYGRLQSSLDRVQTAVGKLNDASLYSSLSTSVLGEGITATAGSSASAGRYEVEVVHAARGGSLASYGEASATDPVVGVGGDTLTLSFGGKDDVEVVLEEGWSLSQIRDAINAHPEAGVTASIINDGSQEGYRLVLSSADTGAAAGIEGMKFDNNSLNQDTSSLVAGRDAELKINNILITSASNRVEGAIQGMTLELDSSATGKVVTVVVEQDAEKLKEAVQGFVSAFNEMKSTVGRMTNVTGDAETAGELVGDRTIRTIETRLGRDLVNMVEGGAAGLLSDVGISLRPNGRLELDEAKLDDVIASEPQRLADFFAGDDSDAGLAGRLEQTLAQFLGSDGLVQSSITSAETRVTSLENRFERMELSIERTLERYRRQFGQLDSMLSQMNATSAYLSQQFDMLSQMGGQRR
ncbi:flagellar hook protein [Halomonas sp. 1513]|nr:flagellar filament capping protein FliD [Halomonas sp. 1513]APX92781.1 flagellar hook protein [Halomonas sp. 1513]